MPQMIGNVTKRRYTQLVDEGRQLIAEQSRCQWAIGDRALEIEPMGAHGGPHADDDLFSVTAALAMFAEDIGIPASTLETYRWDSSRWPANGRLPDVSHFIHHVFAGRDDRTDLINNPPLNQRTGQHRWNTDSARRAVGWKVTQPASTQEKVQRIHDLARDEDVAATVATDLLRRPDVAFRAMRDPTARHLANTAQVDQARQAGAAARQRTPAIAHHEHAMEFLDLVGGCAEFVASMGRIVPALRGHRFTPEERATVHKNLARVRTTADWIESAIDSDNVTIDEGLADLLRGESE